MLRLPVIIESELQGKPNYRDGTILEAIYVDLENYNQ